MAIDDVRFRCEWRIGAAPDAVRAVLVDLAAYPSWWSSVVEARVAPAGVEGAERAPEDAGTIVIRGSLPVALRLRLAPMPAADGVLAARIRGDLLGWCSWHISADGDGARVVFQQHVIVRRRALRIAPPISRRLLRANHARIMRAGEAGLRRLLER